MSKEPTRVGSSAWSKSVGRKPPAPLTWSNLEPLRVCVQEVLTLPIREKGIVLPTTLRNRILNAGLQVWPERTDRSQYPVVFPDSGQERHLTIESACALRDLIQRAIEEAVTDEPSPLAGDPTKEGNGT